MYHEDRINGLGDGSFKVCASFLVALYVLTPLCFFSGIFEKPQVTGCVNPLPDDG